MYAEFWWGNLKRDTTETARQAAPCVIAAPNCTGFLQHFTSSCYKIKTRPLISPFRHDIPSFTNDMLDKFVIDRQTAPGRCRMEGKFSSHIGFYGRHFVVIVILRE